MTPEDLGRVLAHDEGVAAPAFVLDALHTTQEMLQEGMQPRISGMGTAPHGLMAAAMPAVGIYHFGDPEYAYLDGVELASVAQPRLGADWAALSAAAIAASFDPANSAEDIVEKVLALAHENAKEVFYELNLAVRQGGRFKPDDGEADLSWWRENWGLYDGRRWPNMMGNNPLFYVLPVVKAFDGDAQKMFATLLWPEGSWLGGSTDGQPGGGGRDDGRALRSWRVPGGVAGVGRADRRAVVRHRAGGGQAGEEGGADSAHVRPAGREDGRQRDAVRGAVYGCLLASSIGNAMGSSTRACSTGRSTRSTPAASTRC